MITKHTMLDSPKKNLNASVIDLFCGAGGLSHGFYQEGFPIAAGIDIDENCRYPYEQNNDAPFICKDVSGLDPDELNRFFLPNSHRILVGCAPCQPFSTYNQKNDDPKWQLLEDFGDIIDRVRPDIVSMENVPRLMNFRGGGLFRDFVDILEETEYSVVFGTLFGPEYGLPQTRSRLVLIASKLGQITLPVPSYSKKKYKTVADAIGSLPPLNAGEVDPKDPMHQCSGLSPINLKRIKSSRPGGTWRDWPSHLVSKCHTRSSGRTYSGVYGRMAWNEPSPTITTQFFGFGNGRFGHPEQHRALSLREGAVLQSFPKGYKFVAPSTMVKYKNLGRMIGNAVPVALARAIARTIKQHLIDYS